jgi:hypothetical protein
MSLSMSHRFNMESLEPRRLFTGVTLITHGLGGSASDWVTQMGNAIAAQSGPLASQPRYLMTAQDSGHDGGPITVTSTRLGPAPADWGSDEIIVLLDWSDIAGSLPFGGYHRTTQDVGAAVASKLLGDYSIPDLAAPLAELPVHLIGHSRGAGLISELAKGLGQRGAWVDQLTYLDPHPVDGINEPFGINFGDAAMRVYGNVQYAEDYWRTDGNGGSFDFTGEPVNGAYNLQLSESILSNGGYSIEHSDTHLWYHGTIGPPYPESDGGASIGPGWYNPPQGPRDQLGFRFSRLGRGARPAAGLKTSGAFRDPLTLTASGADVYDNIAIDGLRSDFTLQQGTPIEISTRFEDRSVGGNRDATITLGLDRDDNPFNGFYGAGMQFSSASLSSDSLSVQLPTDGLAGGFRLYAKISNGVTTRYDYAPARAIITAAGFDATWIGPATGGVWSDADDWSGGKVPGPADRVSIFDSRVTLTASVSVAALALPGGSQLETGVNDLIINYDGDSPMPAIESLLVSARDGGAWDGPGITSAPAGASGLLTSLSLAEAFDAFGLTAAQTMNLHGQTIDVTSIIVKYTDAGDADLDGSITADDYFRIDAGYLGAGVPAPSWSHGDFDFNHRVDGDDYFLIDKNYADQNA